MGPAKGAKSIGEVFGRRVAQSGGAEAYRTKIDGVWTPVTWEQFGAQVNAATAGLIDLGIEAGERIAICGPCRPTWCEADLAALNVGCATLGVYETLLLDEIEYLINDSQAVALFVDTQELADKVAPLLGSTQSLRLLVTSHTRLEGDERVMTFDQLKERGRKLLADRPEVVDQRLAAVRPEDHAAIIYTSGTTGRPKGVCLTHANVMAFLEAAGELINITADDITMSFLPMAHVAERVSSFYGRINRGFPTAYATNLDTVLDEIAEVRPTYFGGVPRIYEKMYGRILEAVAVASPLKRAIFNWARSTAVDWSRRERRGESPSLRLRVGRRLADRLVYTKLREVFGGRVKYFISGAAPISLDILEFFHGAGMTILEVYGLSEGSGISTGNREDNYKLGTVGLPIPGVEATVAEDGELLLRGDPIFVGYLGMPEATAEAKDADGRLHTGDIATIDEDGFITITDRKKNLIKTSGGKYVAPAKIEQLLKEEPMVSQAYIHGDMRKYVVALITIDPRECERLGEEWGVVPAEVPTHETTHKRIAAIVEYANGKLARYEQLKKFAVLDEDFTIDNGLCTPTLKIKRKLVAERYAGLLDSLYD